VQLEDIPRCDGRFNGTGRYVSGITGMTATLIAIAAGVLGWVLGMFVGRPLRRFFELRGEIIGRLAQYDNVRADWKSEAVPIWLSSWKYRTTKSKG
jgi:hypothetical protein